MKAVLCLAIVIGLLISGSGYANILLNPDFTLDADGNVNMNGRSLDDVQDWRGTGWTNVVVPTEQGQPLPPNGIDLAARLTDPGQYLHQDTGQYWQADTEYTLSFDAFAMWSGSENLAVEWFADGDYIGWSRSYVWVGGSSTEWSSRTASFDTTGEGVAGKEIGIRLMHWDKNGRTLVNNVELIPEPATIALLGLGSVVLLKRRG